MDQRIRIQIAAETVTAYVKVNYLDIWSVEILIDLVVHAGVVLVITGGTCNDDRRFRISRRREALTCTWVQCYQVAAANQRHGMATSEGLLLLSLAPFKAGLVLIPAGRPSRARASCSTTRREDSRQTSAKMS